MSNECARPTVASVARIDALQNPHHVAPMPYHVLPLPYIVLLSVDIRAYHDGIFSPPTLFSLGGQKKKGRL
jgi:hypothetical protein